MTVTSTSFVFADVPRVCPPGYSLAPVFAGETGMVRVCAVLKDGLVPLRETMDAKVYLGALADRAGRVREWLEIWVQDVSGLAQSMAAYREVINNRVLDERWKQRAQMLAQAPDAGLVQTGAEQANPAPVYLDAKAAASVEARDKKTNAPWALCKDEGLLSKKGLPGYAATLSRHLYQPDLGDASDVIPVEMATPEALGLPGGLAALNPGGGLMMAVRFDPLSYEQFVDAVAGIESDAGPADGVLKTIAAAAAGQTPGTKGTLNTPQSLTAPGAGWLMLAASDRSGRLVESLHLKLMALAGAAAAARDAIAATQAPMLNLTANSFRVSLGSAFGATPLLWSNQVALVEPGEGVEMPVEGTDVKYFVAGRGGGLSMYSPAGVSQQVQGKGWLRLRNIVNDGPGGTILEGTLQTQERVIPGKNDLLWMRYGLGPTRVDQYATVDAKGSMAPGEVRIRTIPTRLKDDVAARLKQALGVPIPEVQFGILPMLSSACDLYSMGVLGIRTLLVGAKNPLPVSLDELMTLAGLAANEASTGEDLWVRVGRAFEAEKRWAGTLGPQLLLSECQNAAEAFEAIPPQLWYQTLAAIIRCFSGLGPDSRCRDFGDAPPGGQHKVFDGLLDDLYALLTACRTLIVADFALNSEIRGVVKDCMGGR
ncbi:MAG: hypothetical protein GC200_01655 [Tepidisphaera sp.]|nr:hypothetical protein [Tepidisphaera sp.]